MDRSPGRADRRDDSHADTHEECCQDGVGLEDQRPGREGDPEALQQCLEADRCKHSEPEAGERRDETDDPRLSYHRREDLPPARPEYAKQRGSLACAARRGSRTC